MDLKTFLHNLHFDTDKARPPDFEVDWDDAPLAYKLYRGLPTFPLSSDVPLTLEGQRPASLPDLRDIGHFLWYAYGLTALSQSGFVGGGDPGTHVTQVYRRFAPSGGALYPNELYVYLNIEEIPCGVYHYDVAHHRLVLLREGQFHPYLTQALANRCNVSRCFGAIFVSTMFWKNYYKYNNFAYRLQGLDAGALMGQVLEVSRRFGFESAVYFQFLDNAVNHLLGLSEREESVYAVIPLSVEPAGSWFTVTPTGGKTTCATALCRALPSVQHEHYVRSRSVQDYPMLIQMNEASKLETVPPCAGQQGRQNCCGDSTVSLPCVTPTFYDFAAVCRSRYSPGTDFVLGKIPQEKFAMLLKETTQAFSYRTDLNLDGVQGALPRVSLYVCLYGVEGVEDGAYCYDPAAHVLRQIRPGDHRFRLQDGMSMHNVNLSQVPLCFHVAGDRDHWKPSLGYRGYRIQQMEAGMLVQRLLLAVSAMGMNGHPLLGFDAEICDDIYKMVPQGITSLIQIPVGPYRLGSKLEGGLHA
ncbi:SagB family peptide dehydrogenase [Alicyclobacillus pomorum]|uniref:SagB family peptide dehydrogenase n=1 Tax=Alicyclobacillus pomorum TaxID=204470 RepID=UPI00041F7D9E|nr:SagB family peptide dehydrogenase [Alicyclobacillus pomorum]